MFDNLEVGLSREAASAWAMERMQANDAVGLIYNPPTAEDSIWEALMFLAGVDLITDMAGSYLYSPQDFELYRP